MALRIDALNFGAGLLDCVNNRAACDRISVFTTDRNVCVMIYPHAESG